MKRQNFVITKNYNDANNWFVSASKASASLETAACPCAIPACLAVIDVIVNDDDDNVDDVNNVREIGVLFSIVCDNE